MKHRIHLLADRIWRSSPVARPFLPVSSQVQVLEFTERKASNSMLVTGSIRTKTNQTSKEDTHHHLFGVWCPYSSTAFKMTIRVLGKRA